MAGKYSVIREAIASKTCLLARHRGIWLTLAPYAVGWRDEHPHLVAYAVTGTPGWLSLRVAELSDLRAADVPWAAPYGPPAADMEMDVIEVRTEESEPEKILPPWSRTPALTRQPPHA